MSEREFDLRTVSLYEPLKIQSSKLAAPLLFFLAFGVIQGVRSHGFGWGIVGRLLGATGDQPNDYALIVAGSLIGFATIVVNVLVLQLHRADGSPFVLGTFGIVPAITSLILMVFLFYLIAYRGLWSLTELTRHFTVIPFLKILFFSMWGWRSYRAFCHLYQMRRLVEARKTAELVAYIDTHRLAQFR